MMLFHAATTPEDAEQIRLIRNEGRIWMTRDTSEISAEQQQVWWAERDPQTCWIWLLVDGGITVGYGMLRLEADQWWCSVAVLPEHWSKGYGTKIYKYLALRNEQSTWAEILADNPRSIKAALRAGYQLAWMTDKHAVMRFDK